MAVAVSAGLGCRAHAQTGTIQDVQHVVIFMQENRSFDHYCGSLKGVRGFNDPNALVFPNGNTDFYQPQGASYVLPFHIMTQCLNDVDHSEASGDEGWDGGKWDQWIEAKGPVTMAYYTRADLPFLYALADAYTICDEYHCSVLGPTYPNRLYLMTSTIDPNGVAGGPVTDNSLSRPYSWTTYPERLQAAGVTWKVYQQASDYYNLNALRWFTQYASAVPGNPLYDRGLVLVNNLLAAFTSDVTNGTLPQVSWIIPPWSLSEHPPFAPANGQVLTKQLLDALASNPAVYNSTVFILTYDEDGGFFDHVPAPVPPPGTTNEFVNGLPIGLGVRVPTIVVSPWSRGGYVCSQVFDHTSVIRFLEQWTGVQEPNISDWRRQVCGDLTSAFDFTSPDTSYPFLPVSASVTCVSNVTPVPPLPQTVPVQEPGTNLSRARPYRSNAFSFADCANHRLGITMTNAGIASAHFAIYANAFRTDGPWQYDVPASGSVTDYFSVLTNGGRYDFTCYGPHTFHQRFAGSITTNCDLLNVQASLNPDGNSIVLAFQNATTTPVTFTVTNNAQPSPVVSYTVQPGYLVTHTFPGAVDPDGLYSLAAAASTDPTFLREFEGDTDTAELQFTTNAPPVVSNTAPVVMLIGDNPLTNECHTAFTDPGATATDSGGGSLTVTASSTVNANAVGTYTIQYSATDPSGNSATNTRTVYVVDTTPPVVTLIGDNPMTSAVHTVFTDPGATADDACAGSLSVTLVNTVNPHAVGTYTNSYTATDPSGNSATNTRTVYIVEGTNVAGCVAITNSFTLLVTNADANCEAFMPDVTGTNYIQATDGCSDTLTITQDPTNNAPLALGANEVVIVVTDGSNNVAYSTNTIIVTDVTPPVVTLIGANPLTNVVHTFFTDPGATAATACAGSLSVAINGTVNVNAPGTYTIEYSATDLSGNSATNTRTVYVVAPPPPVVSMPAISLSGGNLTLTYPTWAAAYTLEWATDLASGAWTPVSASPVTNGDNAAVTLDTTVNPIYFRLRP